MTGSKYEVAPSMLDLVHKRKSKKAFPNGIEEKYFKSIYFQQNTSNVIIIKAQKLTN
jgi:hypothetical protein